MSDETAEEFTIEVPATATPADAQALCDRLAAELPGKILRVEAAQAETLCTPYILSLMSALETNAAIKPPVRIVGATEPFIAAFTDLGFFQEMMRMEFAT